MTDIEGGEKNMKKRIVIVLVALVLTGCGVGEKDKNSEVEKIPVENTQVDSVTIDVEIMKEEFLDLDTYSTKNTESTDGQSEFSYTRGASSDLGLYFWEESRGKSIWCAQSSGI